MTTVPVGSSALEIGVQPLAKVFMKAGAEEEGLLSAVKSGNKDRVTKAIEALPAPAKSAMSKIDGDWQAA